MSWDSTSGGTNAIRSCGCASRSFVWWERLFRCNLACAGCGKIDYPDKILNQRISVADALHSMDECGAPVVVLAGGEPLLHQELPQIVEGALKKGKFVTVCTNALLLEKKIDLYKPHNRFNWSIHL